MDSSSKKNDQVVSSSISALVAESEAHATTDEVHQRWSKLALELEIILQSGLLPAELEEELRAQRNALQKQRPKGV